jgi:superfamily II DNA or RNA helicase
MMTTITTTATTAIIPTTNKQSKSYLGKKGYTILKNDISIEELNHIRKSLIVKPHVHGVGGGFGTETTNYPVYRESVNKIYIPRYYGIEHYGLPKMILPDGLPINCPFIASLRPIQIPVVEAFMINISNGGGGGLLELPCAFGKTVISLYICSLLQKKTLIIVHKEFLMNQWIERIREFIPNARIGKIQGPVIDIEEKDIVLGMLQSLSMKEYPANIFDSFGLTIIDEVHHISSEVFSCALFKIVTKFMMGLSATMNRKDGTTSVFKMFLGEVVYKGKREEDYNVIVRAIEYDVDDDDFNEVLTDYRGNVKYSTMISKLCTYNRRTEFILQIIIDMFKENGAQQIMILAHNKNILKYLYDAIKHRQIAEGSVGYYIGGMKENALKETESKSIVIATYSMAAEALDIKTLTTLIMATPKTDIEQAVGRILRAKHGNPIVVDIIDKHTPFQNQWRKRKQFYKKQNYTIVKSASISDVKHNVKDEDLFGKCLLKPFMRSNTTNQNN